ncbi:MAG: hypothetical protein ABJA16_10065 [Nakamurella sp.]
MSESDESRPPDEPVWVPRSPPAEEDSDWLFSWSRSTRQAPPDPPASERSLWRPQAPRFGPLLDRVEARRLAPILDGSSVRMVDTPDGPRRALVHRHWIGLVMRLAAGLVTFIVAIVVSPVYLSLVLLAAAHAGVLWMRRGVKRETAALVGGTELVIGLLIGVFVAEGLLRTLLIVASLLMMLLTVLAWQVDMELVTEGGRLVRTRGLWLMKRTVTAPLTSIRIANTKGPFVGLGYVTVDTPSDKDDMLHNFGLIGQPNEWAALLLREATLPKVTSSPAAAASQAD